MLLSMSNVALQSIAIGIVTMRMDCYSMGISTHNWCLQLHACHAIVHLDRDSHIWRYHKRPLPLLA